MNEDSMQNADAPRAGTPLSVFQSELSKYHGGNKRKKFLYVTLPIILIVLIVGGYFVYRSIKIRQERDEMIQDIQRNSDRNKEAIDKMNAEGKTVPDSLVNAANKIIESSKLDPNSGISREEVEKIKQSSQ